MIRSIKVKLILLIAVPVLSIYLLVSLDSLLQFEQTSLQLSELRMGEKSNWIAEKLEKEILAIERKGFLLHSEFLTNLDMTQDEIIEKLKNITSQSFLLDGACLAFDAYVFQDEQKLYAPYVSNEGDTLKYVDLGLSYNYLHPKHKWFNEPKNLKHGMWSDPYFANVANKMLCSYSLPIFKNETLWAVLVLDISLSEILERIKVELNDEYQYYIISSNGSFIVSPFDGDIGKIIDESGCQKRVDHHVFKGFEKIINEPLGKNNHYLLYNEVLKENYWVYTSSLLTNNWKILISISKRNAGKYVRKKVIHAALFILLMATVMIILIFIVSKNITNPLIKLTVLSEAISTGEEEDVMDYESKNEIGRLAKSFKVMAAKVKAREELLLNANERLELAIRSSQSGIWDFDAQRGLDFLSPEYYEMIGYENGDRNVKRWKDRIHPEDQKKALNVFNDYYKGITEEYNSEYRTQKKDGSYIWVADQSSIISRNAAGSVLRVTGLIRDITKRKKAEMAKERLVKELIDLSRELEESNNNLDRLNKELHNLDFARNNFLKIISHEIRTPLNGIIGITDLLEQDLNENSDFSEFIEMLKISVDRLDRFSTTALIITELQTESFRLNTKSVLFNNLISKCLLDLESKINEKKLSVVKSNYDTSIELNLNEYYINHALTSVLCNSIKYSPENAEICLSLYHEKGKVYFELIDQGKGFSDLSLNSLFEPFGMGEDHYDQNTGLSLKAAKSILSIHEGDIQVKNLKNGASVRFVFNL